MGRCRCLSRRCVLNKSLQAPFVLKTWLKSNLTGTELFKLREKCPLRRFTTLDHRHHHNHHHHHQQFFGSHCSECSGKSVLFFTPNDYQIISPSSASECAKKWASERVKKVNGLYNSTQLFNHSLWSAGEQRWKNWWWGWGMKSKQTAHRQIFKVILIVCWSFTSLNVLLPLHLLLPFFHRLPPQTDRQTVRQRSPIIQLCWWSATNWSFQLPLGALHSMSVLTTNWGQWWKGAMRREERRCEELLRLVSVLGQWQQQ